MKNNNNPFLRPIKNGKAIFNLKKEVVLFASVDGTYETRTEPVDDYDTNIDTPVIAIKVLLTRHGDDVTAVKSGAINGPYNLSGL
jgi:hypothetical protein